MVKAEVASAPRALYSEGSFAATLNLALRNVVAKLLFEPFDIYGVQKCVNQSITVLSKQSSSSTSSGWEVFLT